MSSHEVEGTHELQIVEVVFCHDIVQLLTYSFAHVSRSLLLLDSINF